MELSEDQQRAFEIFKEGYNVFITGPGGTGKTELIRRIYTDAKMRSRRISVTAMTGCAAVLLNCNASTLHSWAGIGLGAGNVETLVQTRSKYPYVRAKWKETDILVIDEVSMMSVKLFDIINKMGKAIRRNDRPFGGIQVVMSGDFFQLPPVGDEAEPETQQFCFQHPAWDEIFNHQVELRKMFRQTDPVYAGILNDLREGRIRKKSHAILLDHVNRDIPETLSFDPTKLYPTKHKVTRINQENMGRLTGEERTFTLERKNIGGSSKDKTTRLQYTAREIEVELDFLANNLLCDQQITLKVGAQVMCIVNMKNETGSGISICNGSQGIVTKFCPFTGFPVVLFTNGMLFTITPHLWSSEKIPGVCVSQLPLILAWALTIHKSQGATLDVAEIDVGKGIFECGQTYVALSRIRSLDGLFLKAFDIDSIRVNSLVVEYYRTLRSRSVVAMPREETIFHQDEIPDLSTESPPRQSPYFSTTKVVQLGAINTKPHRVETMKQEPMQMEITKLGLSPPTNNPFEQFNCPR